MQAPRGCARASATMDSMDPGRTLRRLARHPCAPVDLAELALWLARDEYPALDVGLYLDRLDALAAGAAPRHQGGPLARRVEALSRYLFEEQGYRGNTKDY